MLAEDPLGKKKEITDTILVAPSCGKDCLRGSGKFPQAELFLITCKNLQDGILVMELIYCGKEFHCLYLCNPAFYPTHTMTSWALKTS